MAGNVHWSARIQASISQKHRKSQDIQTSVENPEWPKLERIAIAIVEQLLQTPTMDSREILTVQFGHLSNYVGAHYWNQQDEYFARVRILVWLV